MDPKPLVDLSQSTNETLAWAAAHALARIQHPSVRETAFQLVANRLPGRATAIEMICRNWQRGDHDLVLNWFDNEIDRYVRHSMETDLRTLWEHHPEPGSELRMLHALYERGPCAFCREGVVRRLMALNALSPAMRSECAQDANEDVRKLVEAD